jgi:2-polyprenyl-3-methyl-5-hydroxy-6-metoxy-1,4-benzoquinol methylase
VCGSGTNDPIPAYRKHHLGTCRSCSMVYATVRPTDKELDDLYSSYPIKADLSPITRLRFLELLGGMEAYRRTTRILDVGSGSGFFLDVAATQGWSVYGVEYDPAIVHACAQRGITMQQGSFDPDAWEVGSFDAITSFEVLEHVMDPQAEVSKFARSIRPGGLLYITTPNFNALSRWLSHPTWNIINYPEHLNYFTPSSLDRLLRAHGFKKDRLTTTGISISRVRSSMTGRQQENVDPNNDDERLRRRIESSKALGIAKSLANSVLGILGKGDTIKAWYRRSP